MTNDFLRKEWKLAQRGVTTKDCRHHPCNGCAVCPLLPAELIDYHKENETHEKTVFVYHER